MTKTVHALVLGIMCMMLTIGISVQIRTVNNNGTTVSNNQILNDLKSQVLKMKEKYESAYKVLEEAQEELEETRTNITSNDGELKKLEEEIKKDNVLLGATEVTGPGVTITLSDATATTMNPLLDPIVHDIDILAIVNELKNAGAEAIDVNGQRIVNTSEISCDGNVIVINGEKIGTPFVINAIGLQERFNTLKRINGNLDYMERAGISVNFNNKVNKVTIQKYMGVINFKYAKTVK